MPFLSCFQFDAFVGFFVVAAVVLQYFFSRLLSVHGCFFDFRGELIFSGVSPPHEHKHTHGESEGDLTHATP